MRRTKEDALFTRQKILSAAFDVFLQEGFDGASLEQICKAAGVTRGAAYWHFKNKKDLYHKTILSVLEQFELIRQKISGNDALSVQEKLAELMWCPTRFTERFQFIAQCVAYARQNPDFQDTVLEIQKEEASLYWFFLSELSKVEEPPCPVEHAAAMIHILFQGLYSYPKLSSTHRTITREMIDSFVGVLAGS